LAANKTSPSSSSTVEQQLKFAGYDYSIFDVLRIGICLDSDNRQLFQEPQIAVINNSGLPISVIGGTASVSAHPTQIVELNYPTEGHRHEFRVSVRACSYRYRVPKSPPADYYKRAGFDGVVVVQLEHDLSLYLALPDAKSADAIAHLESLQSDGFPIMPDGANCPS
jgi:hypothetical protein